MRATNQEIFFLDVNGDAQYGGFSGTQKPFNGYDYVVDLTFGLSNTYAVYKLVSGVVVEDVYDYNSPESSPWRYVSGGGTAVATGTFTFMSGLTNTQTGFDGGLHYEVGGINLSFLDPRTTFISHFTMACGNDNLMGRGTTVPEPGTLLLLGCGLVGLAASRKRFMHK